MTTPTSPDEQSIEQRIAAAEARGFAAGLERAALELRWRSCTCGIRIRALIPVATAPARLDTDKTAQPLTEIRAVVPAGKRIVQPYGVEQYVYQETGATAPKLFDGNVHVTPGSTAVATPPRSEEQQPKEPQCSDCGKAPIPLEVVWRGSDIVCFACYRAAPKRITMWNDTPWHVWWNSSRGGEPVDYVRADCVAEERRRLRYELGDFLDGLDTCGEGSCATVATCEVRERIQRALRMAALGPAPVDDTAARLAAAEDRVRVLEGALQRIVAGAAEASTDLTVSANVSACFAVIEEVARAALAKKSEGT